MEDQDFLLRNYRARKLHVYSLNVVSVDEMKKEGTDNIKRDIGTHEIDYKCLHLLKTKINLY